jgi:hypothetical protein
MEVFVVVVKFVFISFGRLGQHCNNMFHEFPRVFDLGIS